MRKNAKRRSFGRRFFDACLTGVSRMALAAGDIVARNPVVAGGATAFLVTLGFVASNAIWYQPQAHDGVFFKTRPEQVFRAVAKDNSEAARKLTGNVAVQEPVRQITGNEAAPVAEKPQAVATLPETTVDGGDLPALAPNGDKQVAIMQYNLKQLGFYSGNVDGLTGPQTRAALEQWQNVQAKLAPDQNNAAKPAEKQLSIEEAIAVAVPAARPEARPETRSDTQPENSARAVPVAERRPAPIAVRAEEKTPVQAVRSNSASQNATETTASVQPVSARTSSGQAVSAEELVRIQAGLKAFGNDMVVVDGVPGKTTEDAIREFQKLFRLNVSGKPDSELIGKMREIGLIS
ncbi:peptidoglycan-binding domain-containing protein [Pseudochrobactrum saccharolyticum]|uniref:peptidoglycan-binding domain-containing protein n=1 Tax=Pseudochrobactrum saccharolyticum TaxID=354352 RepID=UPI0027552F68|nr:peptidoglycan-binding domain-containing protein [Pseudochrobactrum saccharolyticum]MDP8251428.1 peptidoglycan-binding protein [Pseudochrobactrum saccharolyticum]